MQNNAGYLLLHQVQISCRNCPVLLRCQLAPNILSTPASGCKKPLAEWPTDTWARTQSGAAAAPLAQCRPRAAHEQEKNVTNYTNRPGRYLGYDPKWCRCCTFGPGRRSAPAGILDDAGKPDPRDERTFEQAGCGSDCFWPFSDRPSAASWGWKGDCHQHAWASSDAAARLIERRANIRAGESSRCEGHAHANSKVFFVIAIRACAVCSATQNRFWCRHHWRTSDYCRN